MGSVLKSTICHYCLGRADTSDHIVPRAVLPKPYYTLPAWFRNQNEVPACKDCNNLKAYYRSTCDCPQCLWCWGTALQRFIPRGYRPRGPIQVPAPPPPPAPRHLTTRAARQRLERADTFRARTHRALDAARAQTPDKELADA
jgi:hypothetical protein